MTNLEIAERKLNRIREEQNITFEKIKNENDLIPFGQPNIIGRRNIYKGIQQGYEKSRRLYEEEQQQIRRIEMLEKVEKLKEENPLLKDVHRVGKSSYATVGAKTSVNNLDYFRNKLIELEQSNEKAKAYNKTKPQIKMKTLGAEITKLKRKIEYLEIMEEKANSSTMSEKTIELIESEQVTQWKKKPIYYFVKGLKKVAFEIDDNGNFFISSRYPAYNEKDKEYIKLLLEE